MTDRSKQERDQRALDALFVSQLRRHENSDEVDVEHLPRLTKEDKQSLASLGPNFIDRLLAGEVQPVAEEPLVEDEEKEDLLCAGGMAYGMNRADEVVEETEEAIEEKRNEIIDKFKKTKEGENG